MSFKKNSSSCTMSFCLLNSTKWIRYFLTKIGWKKSWLDFSTLIKMFNSVLVQRREERISFTCSFIYAYIYEKWSYNRVRIDHEYLDLELIASKSVEIFHTLNFSVEIVTFNNYQKYYVPLVKWTNMILICYAICRRVYWACLM